MAAAVSRMPSTVAPLAGAWIETELSPQTLILAVVAPLAGAWIETLADVLASVADCGRAPRGRVD